MLDIDVMRSNARVEVNRRQGLAGRKIATTERNKRRGKNGIARRRLINEKVSCEEELVSVGLDGLIGLCVRECTNRKSVADAPTRL
jgi:hypothetical protein